MRMDVTTYIYGVMKKNGSIHRVYSDLGIDMEKIMREKEKIDADQFLRICQYLGLDADLIMEQFVEGFRKNTNLEGKE